MLLRPDRKLNFGPGGNLFGLSAIGGNGALGGGGLSLGAGVGDLLFIAYAAGAL